ncbi:hypothetical protein VTP01DRAFT_3771 [Rhizomucor pusillus]|uniref:uncharacterized protein n=1 Tax=Rhizomucor pusillus TaxID=4840 RepID=UPI003744464C
MQPIPHFQPISAETSLSTAIETDASAPRLSSKQTTNNANYSPQFPVVWVVNPHRPAYATAVAVLSLLTSQNLHRAHCWLFIGGPKITDVAHNQKVLSHQAWHTKDHFTHSKYHNTHVSKWKTSFSMKMGKAISLMNTADLNPMDYIVDEETYALKQ